MMIMESAVKAVCDGGGLNEAAGSLSRGVLITLNPFNLIKAIAGLTEAFHHTIDFAWAKGSSPSQSIVCGTGRKKSIEHLSARVGRVVSAMTEELA